MNDFQTFDLLDSDKSGTLERDELNDWFSMCGAELDLTKIIDTLTKDGSLTRYVDSNKTSILFHFIDGYHFKTTEGKSQYFDPITQSLALE